MDGTDNLNTPEDVYLKNNLIAADMVSDLFDYFIEPNSSTPIIIFPVNREGSPTETEYEYLRLVVNSTNNDLRDKINVFNPLSPLSLRERKKLFFNLDDHLNARGHTHLADMLQPVIMRSLEHSNNGARK
jgi:hypothetical protein